MSSQIAAPGKGQLYLNSPSPGVFSRLLEAVLPKGAIGPFLIQYFYVYRYIE
jgi:hypothetical protein